MIRQRNGRIILFFLLLFLIGIILLVFYCYVWNLLSLFWEYGAIGNIWGNFGRGEWRGFVYLFAGLNLRILAFFISCDVILYFYYILGFMNLENICITN